MKNICLAGAIFLISVQGKVFAASLSMPDEVGNVEMGMSLEDLLKARPNIQREGMLGAKIRWDAPKLLLFENFPPTADYKNASYLLNQGKLVSVTLVGHPAAGQEGAARRKVLKAYVAKWGKGYHKRIPKDALRTGEYLPTLTWDKNDAEIILTLPKARKKGDVKINALAIQVRTKAESQKHPWKEGEMPAKDRAKYFKDHDVDEE